MFAEGFVPFYYTPNDREREMLATTGTLPGIEARLHPEVILEGRVYGPAGQPLSGVSVALTTKCHPGWKSLGHLASSGDDGSYRLPRIDSEADRYLVARIVLADGTELRSEPVPLSRVVSPVPGREFWWDVHLMPFDPAAAITCSE